MTWKELNWRFWVTNMPRSASLCFVSLPLWRKSAILWTGIKLKAVCTVVHLLPQFSCSRYAPSKLGKIYQEFAELQQSDFPLLAGNPSVLLPVQAKLAADRLLLVSSCYHKTTWQGKKNTRVHLVTHSAKTGHGFRITFLNLFFIIIIAFLTVGDEGRANLVSYYAFTV